MDRPASVDVSSAALLRDALQYVTGVQESLADCRLDHAELDANRAASVLRVLQGRNSIEAPTTKYYSSLAWAPIDDLLAEVARRQQRAE